MNEFVRNPFDVTTELPGVVWPSIENEWARLCDRADEGDRDAMYEVAVKMLSQDDSETETAWKYLRQAAEQGHLQAGLAICLQRVIDAGVEKVLKRLCAEKPETAKRKPEICAALAENRTAEELNRLGEECGERKAWEDAVSWFEKAVKKGHEGARCNLAYCYTTGKGVEKDFERAMELLAAVRGRSEADVMRAAIREKEGIRQADGRTAYDYYLSAAEMGNVFAQVNLGVCYYRGEGVPQNYEEAVHWFREAAEWEENEERNELGEYREKLHGQERGSVAPWFRKFAKQAKGLAKNNLGGCYAEGNGVEKDEERAACLFRSSAESGCEEGQRSFARCCANGDGVERNWDTALSWYKQAAGNLGRSLDELLQEEKEELNECALLLLSDRYYHGWGVDRNLDRAMELYRAAEKKPALTD